MKKSGFTLIEIMIALFVFSILGVILAMSLRSLVRSHQHLKNVQHTMQQLMMTMTLMRRDITQIIQRPVRDVHGALLAPLVISDRSSFELTRTGNTNPLQLIKRSTLLRVGYAFKNHQWIRFIWPVLDRAPQSNFLQQVLLPNVRMVHINFVNNEGLITESWAANMSSLHSGNLSALLPRAIVITITLARFGKIEGVFSITGRGYDERP